MSCYDELLTELEALQTRREFSKSVNYWQPPPPPPPRPRPRVAPGPTFNETMAKLERLAKSITPPPTPAEKAAAEREQLVKRCRTEIPMILEKSMARFEGGQITGDQPRLTQARVIRLTDTLSNYGIQL